MTNYTTTSPLPAENVQAGHTEIVTPIGDRAHIGRMPAFAALAKATGGLYVEDPHGMTIDEALTKAGLDFTVEALTDVSAAYTDDSGVGWVTHPLYRMNVARHADGRVTPVGMTKGRYQIVQNRDAYAFAEIMLGEGGANVAAAGSYGSPHGSRTYLALQLDPFTVAGDDHQMYVTILNSHDGSTGLTALLAPIRLACTNQVTATFRRAKQRITLRHTASIEGRVDEARQVLGLAEHWRQAFQRDAEILLDQPMSPKQFDNFVHTLWTPPRPDASKRTLTLHGNRDAELAALFTASPTTEMGRGTRWAAYNAVTEYLDWGMPVRGGDSPEITRATRTLNGEKDDVKARAFHALLPVAAR